MKKFLLIALTLVVVTGCATQKKEERDIKEKAAQSQVSTSAALGGTIHDLISSSKTLTDAQKQELTQILDANKKRADELTEQSYKFRGVLIQELLSGDMKQKRIKILKKDIKRIEQDRLKNTFDTVEKISKIVSKQPDNEKYTESLINFERSFK